VNRWTQFDPIVNNARKALMRVGSENLPVLLQPFPRRACRRDRNRRRRVNSGTCCLRKTSSGEPFKGSGRLARHWIGSDILS
jgi:hypothetical protein